MHFPLKKYRLILEIIKLKLEVAAIKLMLTLNQTV